MLEVFCFPLGLEPGLLWELGGKYLWISCITQAIGLDDPWGSFLLYIYKSS